MNAAGSGCFYAYFWRQRRGVPRSHGLRKDRSVRESDMSKVTGGLEEIPRQGPHGLLERRYVGYTSRLVTQTLIRVSTRLRPTQEPRVPLGAPRSEIPRRSATVSTGCGGPSTRSTLQRKPK